MWLRWGGGGGSRREGEGPGEAMRLYLQIQLHDVLGCQRQVGESRVDFPQEPKGEEACGQREAVGWAEAAARPGAAGAAPASGALPGPGRASSPAPEQEKPPSAAGCLGYVGTGWQCSSSCLGVGLEVNWGGGSAVR